MTLRSLNIFKFTFLLVVGNCSQYSPSSCLCFLLSLVSYWLKVLLSNSSFSESSVADLDLFVGFGSGYGTEIFVPDAAADIFKKKISQFLSIP